MVRNYERGHRAASRDRRYLTRYTPAVPVRRGIERSVMASEPIDYLCGHCGHEFIIQWHETAVRHSIECPNCDKRAVPSMWYKYPGDLRCDDTAGD